MVLTYCGDCHCEIHIKFPVSKHNINPNNGYFICQDCYYTKYSIDVIRNKKLEEIFKKKPKNLFKYLKRLININ